MISSITPYLKKHLGAMESSFYFCYQNIDMITKQLHHYFLSSEHYYQQYENHLFEEIGLNFSNPKHAFLIKSYEIGLIASSFYLISNINYQNLSQTEQNIHDQLETMNMKQAIETFYQDPTFAKTMLRFFVYCDFFSPDEIKQMHNQIEKQDKSKVLMHLYPPVCIDLITEDYQKKKKI